MLYRGLDPSDSHTTLLELRNPILEFFSPTLQGNLKVQTIFVSGPLEIYDSY